MNLINCTYQFHGDSPKFNRTMTAQDWGAWSYKPQKRKKSWQNIPWAQPGNMRPKILNGSSSFPIFLIR